MAYIDENSGRLVLSPDEKREEKLAHRLELAGHFQPDPEHWECDGTGWFQLTYGNESVVCACVLSAAELLS